VLSVRTSFPKSSIFPASSFVQLRPLTHNPYDVLPCAYLVLEKDRTLPKEYQEGMAAILYLPRKLICPTKVRRVTAWRMVDRERLALACRQFNDLAPETAKKWASTLTAAPVMNSPLTHNPYDVLPCGPEATDAMFLSLMVSIRHKLVHCQTHMESHKWRQLPSVQRKERWVV
jgi:hypothetical protein